MIHNARNEKYENIYFLNKNTFLCGGNRSRTHVRGVHFFLLELVFLEGAFFDEVLGFLLLPFFVVGFFELFVDLLEDVFLLDFERLLGSLPPEVVDFCFPCFIRQHMRAVKIKPETAPMLTARMIAPISTVEGSGESLQNIR